VLLIEPHATELFIVVSNDAENNIIVAFSTISDGIAKKRA
jgi:hypothetical protein